jgi:hypothetical protein
VQAVPEQVEAAVVFDTVVHDVAVEAITSTTYETMGRVLFDATQLI